MQLPFIDGLRNIVANLGTERDKASHSGYALTIPNDADLSAMYRTSAVARKLVDMPAEDACREWREWQGQSDQIEKIEAEEKRLGVQNALLRAKIAARLFGGAAIYIGTGEQNARLPLNPRAIKAGGVKYLTVMPRNDVAAGEIETDPRVPGYNKPRYYTIGTEQVHPSRLVILTGEELPDDGFAAMNGWGDSSLTACMDAVRNLDATVANVASLIFEAKVDVMGIKGFNEGLKNGGIAYENVILARTALVARAKGINGMIVADAEDTYEQKSASFSTLPDIMDRFMQMVCVSPSAPPMTLMFGMSPGGLNASGESDTRGYYDRIKVMQSLELQPAMAILDECLIRSATGQRDEDIHYTWRPLWMPTAKERAETGKTIAETHKALFDMGVLPTEVLGKSVVNGLTEAGAAPGLEGYAAAYFAENKGDDTTPPDATDPNAPMEV